MFNTSYKGYYLRCIRLNRLVAWFVGLVLGCWFCLFVFHRINCKIMSNQFIISELLRM